ncbi:CoA-transferase subunit beta [Chloroflexota bacterium]
MTQEEKSEKEKARAQREKEVGYVATEQMVISAARHIKDKDVIYVGTGLPMLATMLAKHSHAPDATIVIENGTVRDTLFPLPRATDNLGVQTMADMLCSLCYINYLGQTGHINRGFLGAGQVDRYGNVNDTVIGDYYNPVHRWPGSGGANDVMSFCGNTILILRQSKQRFPEKVEFNTCPGYLDGKLGRRQEIGLPPNTGPQAVITNLGTYIFENGEMVLQSIHSDVGVTLEEVKAEVEWDIKLAKDFRDTKPPTKEELKILHEKVDPEQVYRGGGRRRIPQPSMDD